MRVASIVCPGPSLDTSIIPDLHEQSEMVVAVNRGYRAWQDYPNLYPHMIFAVDGPHAWKAHETDEIKNLIRSLVITRGEDQIPQKWRERIDSHRRVIAVSVSKSSFRDKDPFHSDLLKRPLKGTLIAWQYLVRLGFDQIAIAGCDCRTGSTIRYYFDSVPTDPDDRRRTAQINSKAAESYDTVYETLKNWQPYAQARGVRTANISGEGSRLHEFLPSISAGGISQWAQQRS